MSDAKELIGKEVIDSHDYKVGKIEAILEREGGERACWARVKTGLMSHSLVPLQDAQEAEDGRVRLIYEKQHVKAAPKIKTDDGEIDDEGAELLHRHYGLERVTAITIQEDDIELARDTREAKPPEGEEAVKVRKRHPLPKDYRRPQEDSAPERINP